MNKKKKKKCVPQQLAVIDIGSSSVRMELAQMDDCGSIHPIETLSQPISMGSDTFTLGYIQNDTMESCVTVLRGFLKVLNEYQVRDPKKIRAIATSAVRESLNRQAFLDRVFIATGLTVETMDEAEENRFMYHSVYPYFGSPGFKKSLVLIVEIGAGSTDLLALRNEKVVGSFTYRLGAYRMRGILEDQSTPNARRQGVLESEIYRTVRNIRKNLNFKGRPTVCALGGDMRFAAAQLYPDWQKVRPLKILLKRLASFTNQILEESVDGLVKKYHISYSEAETLGPSLLAYVRLANEIGLDSLLVIPHTTRYGILREMSGQCSWIGEFKEQIISSAIEAGNKYQFDRKHGEHVAELSLQLFRALQAEHNLEERHAVVLEVAALLHEVGHFIGNRGHHKHSQYLISNSSLFGLSSLNILLTSLIARYHRRSMPKLTHVGYATLTKEHRIAVLKLAAILRVADALDKTNVQRIKKLNISIESKRLIITTHNLPDITLEQAAMAVKGDMFREVYGKTVVIRKGITI